MTSSDMTSPDLPSQNDIHQLLLLGQAAVEAGPGRLVEDAAAGSPPVPYYPKPLVEFFMAAGQDPWIDYQYDIGQCAEMLLSPNAVEQADLAHLRSLLTFMVRGERFNDGHWGAMLAHGHLPRWLLRLSELA